MDAHIFVEAQKVLDALRTRDCGPALAWCSQHAAKLKKIKSHSLEFKLRLQVHRCVAVVATCCYVVHLTLRRSEAECCPGVYAHESLPSGRS